MSELEQAVAQLFRQKGKPLLSEKEFMFSASMDLRWFSPKESEALMQRCIDAGLILRTAEGLKPNFDYENVDVPLSFKPGKKILEVEKNLFTDIVAKIMAEKGLDKKTVIAKINEKQETLNVAIEVIALIVANECEVDVAEFVAPVEAKVLEGATGG